MGYYLWKKKEQIIDTCNNLDGSQRNYAEWKMPVSTTYISYDCIYIIFLKWQYFINKDSLFQGLGTTLGVWVEGGCDYKSTRYKDPCNDGMFYILSLVVNTQKYTW